MSLLSVVTAHNVYHLLLPSFLIHLTRGLTLTSVPLFVLYHLELSKSHVGIAVGAIGLGKVLSDIPCGYLLGRIGSRNLMIVCGAIVGLASTVMMMALSASNAAFMLVTISMFFVGVGESTGIISRLAIVTDEHPLEERGRISALLGGSTRIAMAVGPLLSGVLTMIFGIGSVFVVQFILALASVAVVLTISIPSVEPTPKIPISPSSYRDHIRILTHVIVFVIALQIVRECRKLVVPLSGNEIGMSVEEISFYSSLSFTLDALLFAAAGPLMDTHGRVFTGCFSVSIMVLSLSILVPAINPLGIFFHSVISGVGNGFSSGLVIAFGADLAPQHNRSEFLGMFRLFADSGELLGPLIVGLVAQYASIPTMLNVVSSVGVLGAFWLIRFVNESPVARTKSEVPVQAELIGKDQETDSRI